MSAMKLLWTGQRLDTQLAIFIDESKPVPPTIYWKMSCRYEPVEYSGTVIGFTLAETPDAAELVEHILENIDSCYLGLEKQRKDEMVKCGYRIN